MERGDLTPKLSGSTTAHLSITAQGWGYSLEPGLSRRGRAVPAFMGLLGYKPTLACPSTQHLPATHPAPLQVLQSPDVLRDGSHCQARCSREKGGISLRLWGRWGKHQDFCSSLLSSFSAPLWLSDDFTPCTLHASPRTAAH